MFRLPGRALLPTLLVVLVSTPAQADDSFPAGLLPEGVTPLRYALELTIDPRREGFTGRVAIDVEITRPARIIWLHGLGLKNVEAIVEAGGVTVAAAYSEVDPVSGVARLELERELGAGRATLRFSYAGAYREGSEGLFLVEEGGQRYVFSQFQAIEARRVFPGFDQPAFKTPFDITVVAVAGDAVISNTPITASEPAGAGLVTHRFQRTLPLPTYLLAFAVGPLDVIEAPPLPANDLRERPVPLRGVATRGKSPRLAFALANTADMVARLERYFGSPFPYPKLDLIAVPSLGYAMENAGAITYDESMLLLDENAPPAQLRSFGAVHAHELSHQWFGDLVTPWWWEDIWLNESFATWMGFKIASAWRPPLFDSTDLASEAFRAMDVDSRAAVRPVREPVDDNRRVNSTFDSLTYNKGGAVLQMFETYLGEEAFRNGVRLHLQRHPHATATSDDFFRALADASGQPAVVEAFRSFVEQPGVPLVSVALAGDGGDLLLSQSRYRPIGASFDDRRGWKIPVCVSTYGEGPPAERCVLLGQAEGRLPVPAATQNVMPNANGAAYYRFAMDAAALHRLVAASGALPDREALALADSVRAGFRAGRVTFAVLLDAARQLAAHRNRRVALALGSELAEIGRRWAGPAQRAAIAETLVELYAPRLEALGLDPRAGAYATDDPDRRLLRRELAELLALEAGHGPTGAVLARAASRSLADPAALDPEYRAPAWAVGVREYGEPFARAIADRLLDGTDSRVRGDAAGALGSARDPAVSAVTLRLVMHPHTRSTEMFTLIAGQISQPETQAAAWRWLQDNVEDLLGRLATYDYDSVYSLPSAFCDPGLRSSAAGFIRRAAAAQRASPLQAARTLESIDLCIAQKQALREQVAAGLGPTMR